MRYWVVEMGNGYCGCDEKFLTTTENAELNMEDCLDMYCYQDGAAGLSPEDEEFEEYSYEECICDNTNWEEISKEDFEDLRDNEGYEVR